MNQRYYIAVPNKITNWGYQTMPTWKNYSFTGTLEDAQDKAIELFTEAGYLNEDDILDYLSDYYDENTYQKLYYSWDNLSDEEKHKHTKKFYVDFLRFEIDDVNKGLALWDEISNDQKKNIYQDDLKVIELN